MSTLLANCRQSLASATGLDRARLAVEIAELEPLLGHRTAPVRAAIAEAARALDETPDPELEARVLLRMASLKMVEQEWDAADAALAAVGDKVGRDGPWMYLSAVRACRVAIRRGDRAVAAATLDAGSRQLEKVARDTDPGWQRSLIETELGIAEVAMHSEPGSSQAFEALEDLIGELGHDARWIDEIFTARQILVVDALARADAARAANLLRDVVKVAQDLGSPEDEIEARIARASALMARGDRPGLDEAERVVQIARDRALEHGLEDLHVAALIAQAGLMDERGKTQGALDRCLEIARSGAANGDVRRYIAAVGIMSNIYQKNGDFPSAYRAIAESYHALSTATGKDVKPLFTPLLESLRDVMGPERFSKMVDDVNTARRLADAHPR
jgi:hypothetical protein